MKKLWRRNIRKLKLTFPELPPSTNLWQHLHWAAKDRLKQTWDGEIMMALIEGYSCNRIKPLMDRANILIKLYFRTKHTRDKDNYAGFKGILDGLKKRVIRDDSSDKINVDWELLYDKDKPRTEIIVEEIG